MSENNFEKQFERATKAGEEANKNEARAVGVRYDATTKEILVELRHGGIFAFASYLVAGLRGKSDDDLADVQLSPSGGGLHWERLDEDLSLPALIEGSYGKGQEADIDLDQLCAQIETAWYSERDPSTIDRFAEQYPQYSGDLYDFFALLIETDLPSHPFDSAASTETARKWLEAEGFGDVQKIAASMERPTTTTPAPSVVVPSTARERETSSPEEQPPESGKVLSFAAYARSKAGLSVLQAARQMDVPLSLLVMIQNEPPDVQLGVRREIAERSGSVGLDPQVSYESLRAPQQMAALNTSTGPPKSFRTRLAQIGLTDDELTYWLVLADEDRK